MAKAAKWSSHKNNTLPLTRGHAGGSLVFAKSFKQAVEDDGTLGFEAELGHLSDDQWPNLLVAIARRLKKTKVANGVKGITASTTTKVKQSVKPQPPKTRQGRKRHIIISSDEGDNDSGHGS